MVKKLFNYATDIVDILPVGTTFTVQDLFGDIVWKEVRAKKIQKDIGNMFKVAVKSKRILGKKVQKIKDATDPTATVYERI